MRALRSQDIPLLPLARNHDKTRISIFRVIAPLAFHCNRRFPFNRSPFDNGEIFPRERERTEGGTRERKESASIEDAAGPYYRLRERVHRGRGWLKVVVKGIDSINKKENMDGERTWERERASLGAQGEGGAIEIYIPPVESTEFPIEIFAAL